VVRGGVSEKGGKHGRVGDGEFEASEGGSALCEHISDMSRHACDVHISACAGRRAS
jgi:hypothetical protein